MRTNKNTWVTPKEMSQMSDWLRNRSLALFIEDDFLEEETDEFYGTLHRLCLSKSCADTLSHHLETNIKLDAWRKIKQRYRRYKHRQNKGASTIEVSQVTMDKLRVFKEIHGYSNFNEIIDDLLSKPGVNDH